MFNHVTLVYILTPFISKTFERNKQLILWSGIQ